MGVVERRAFVRGRDVMLPSRSHRLTRGINSLPICTAVFFFPRGSPER